MDCSPGVSQQTAEVNALNSKLQYDAAAQLQNQALIDNQNFARQANALMQRAAEDSQTIKHLATVGLLQAGQTGMTENQQSVSPIRTATGDAIVGGVGVSAEQVAANVADIATALAPVISAAIANAVAQYITNAGAATKPTTGAA